MAVKTKVQKSPKYKGAPLAPKVAKPKPKPKAKAKAKKRKTKWYPGKLVEGIFGSKKKRLKKAYEAEGATKEEAKKKAKKKARGAGRIRKGAVGVKSTKGGEYAKYGKKSKAAKSFRQAFKDAGGKDFTWDGRKYSGKKAEEGGKVESYSDGGKVESNPYGWPSSDARGKK